MTRANAVHGLGHADQPAESVTPAAACIHFAALVAAQASFAWVYYRTPWMRTAVVVPLLFRLLVWTAPVLVWLVATGHNPIRWLKLHPGAGRGLAWGLLVGVPWAAANVIGHGVLTGDWHFSLVIGLSQWVNAVVFVGFSEEVVFRGFYLPAFVARFGFARANVLQALLFLGIHLPGWALSGRLFNHGALQLCASIAFFGLITGWLLRRTRSLWTCMLFHSFNNLASFVTR
jgi:membrane protease YdiL (CAAX protease family)